MSLIEETKKAMKYKSNQVRCDGCEYFKEEEHPDIDRAWVQHCHFSNLTKFEVNPDAFCQHHKPMKKV